MHVPDCIGSPFDFKIENADIEFHLQDELIDMSADLEASSLFKSKNLSDYWTNVNITTKYPKFSAAVEPFLLAFPSSYNV